MQQKPGRRSRRNSTQRRKIAAAIFNQYDNTCVYCGATNVTLTVDHLFPLAKGGMDVRGNMVAACQDCNREKEDMTVIEWIDTGKAPDHLHVYINHQLYGGTE